MKLVRVIVILPPLFLVLIAGICLAVLMDCLEWLLARMNEPVNEMMGGLS